VFSFCRSACWKPGAALLSNTNNVEQWLPEIYEETTTFKWFQKHLPASIHPAQWDGCTARRSTASSCSTHKLMPPEEAQPDMILRPSRPCCNAGWAPVYRYVGAIDDKTPQATEEPRYFFQDHHRPSTLERLTCGRRSV